MKKLWRKLTPPLADSFGFLEVIRRTDGIGLLDDCGGYRLAEGRHEGPDIRTACSEVDETDIVGGTREKVLQAFGEYQKKKQGAFALLAFGPCAAMIGTDHAEIAQTLSREYAIPVGTAQVTGQKNYDVGIAQTLLAMGELLAVQEGCAAEHTGVPENTASEIKHPCINLIGGTAYDLGEKNALGVKALLEQQGITVIACPGREVSRSELERMGEAALNVVLTVSGLPLAKALQQAFGTQYLAVSPFGASFVFSVWEALGLSAEVPSIDDAPQDSLQATSVCSPVLIIAEQFTGNAIRESIHRCFDQRQVQVMSLFQMERNLMQSGDRRLRSEEEVQKVLSDHADWTVIGDADYRACAPDGIRWISLPHPALHQYTKMEPVPLLLGDALEVWVRENL